MKLDAADLPDLKPLIDVAVRSTLDQIQAVESRLGNRIGYVEREAAEQLGLHPWVLADARRRGEIRAKRIGKKYVYSRASLVAFLEAADA